jgi:ketosteroid isomerase-like protein
MPQTTVTDHDLAALIERTAESASVWMRGDMRRYLELITHADDYTLMMPYGGEAVRGFDESPERLEATARYFRNGEAAFELVQAHASAAGDLVVLVAIERQHGEVGGLPDRDWSLRVTLVYRREGSDWLLVHRHADPLVDRISLEQMAALKRG